ncbi:DUF72 domain-containing protein [Chelatococcus reniformis]|uniref:DUF72 domain-containing protein n=1 Tax=Chelatococcus reniformis TaxID=1494448 RepID=A0A916URM3_9HYPH|nr:DUF72 domain-containing protein [Chelatococcus reniformis]GGC83577.1 hypothetical protein GCM10010994_46820 [Chelatococcus reniformis]
MIRVGIGGWTFEPWRGTFYPPKLPVARELAHASRQVTAIEVNGTFYGSQKPASYRKWADESPDGFVFSLKAPRFAVNRRVLAEGGESIERFFASGPTELGAKLGPILWQLPPTKRFDPEDIARFLALLPASVDGLKVRHALEVRHESFLNPDLLDLLRQRGVAVVYADSAKYPAAADRTADFVYARLQQARADEPTGYAPDELDQWAARARTWASGATPAELPHVGEASRAPAPEPVDVFIFMINGAKERAPHAAMALIERL